MSAATIPHTRASTRKLLNVIGVVAVIDAGLLAPLVWASITGHETLVSVLGPIHGIGFLILVGLVGRGAVDGRWGWYFPAIVVVTGGPLGSLVGDVRERRRLARIAASDARADG